MEKTKRRRITIAGLLVVMLLLGIGTFFMFNQSFEIRFNSGGGQIIAPYSASPRTATRFEGRRFTPIMPGWTFLGWSTTGQEGGIVESTSDLRTGGTLHAVWEQDSYFAQMYVEGVRIRSVNILSNAQITPAMLNDPSGDWVVMPDVSTSFERFFGWRFYDIHGQRTELIRDHMTHTDWWLYDFGWSDIEQDWVVSARRQVTAGAPFLPDLYDTTYHAIVDQYTPSGGATQYGSRTVALAFHNQNFENTVSTVPSLRFGQEIDLNNLVGTPTGGRTFLGWRIEARPESLSPLHTMVDGVVTSVARMGHNVDETMRVHDLNRLNQMLSRTFMPRETFTVDSLLHYVSWMPTGVSGQVGLTTRVINFFPVFAEHTYYLRTTDVDGNVTLRPITSDSDQESPFRTEIPARLEENRIVLLRPATRTNMRFLHFQFFPSALGESRIIAIDQTPYSIYLNTLNLSANHALIIDMVWEGVDDISVNFDFAGNLPQDYLSFIYSLDFEGTVRADITDPDQVTRQIVTRVGDVIMLPSVSMYAAPNMHFSHWEFRHSASHSIAIGAAGHMHEVNAEFIDNCSYTLHAVWVDSRVNFAFNLNGGRNFTPDLSNMRGREGQVRSIPQTLPQRYGYTFLHWQVGTGAQARTFHPSNVDHQQQITIAARRQTLVAQWQPRLVRIELEYSFVNQFGNPVTPLPITFEVPFDSSIQLRRIETAAYFDTVQHIGWRFNDQLRNLNMDFTPTQTIRIDENFAVRTMGSLNETALFPNPTGQSNIISGQDIKEGRLFNVALNDRFGSGTRTDHANMFNWHGAISVIQNGEAVQLPRYNTVSRDFFVDRMLNSAAFGSGANGVAQFNWYAEQMETHDFIGFVYVPETRVPSFAWGSLFNIETGTFDNGALYRNPETGALGSNRNSLITGQSQDIFLFDDDGFATFPAPTGEMRLYKLWMPKAIEIQIFAYETDGGTAINNIPIIISYVGDQRARTNITNDGTAPAFGPGETVDTSPINFHQFTVDGGAFGVVAGERFVLWQAEFIFRTGETFTTTIVPHANRNHITNNLFENIPTGMRNLVVSQINLTRVTQYLNSFLIRVENTHFLSQQPHLTYGIGGEFTYNASRGGTFVTPIMSVGTINRMIQLGVDPNLRTLAAQNGQRVVGYSTVPGDNWLIPTGQVFNLGQDVHITHTTAGNAHLGHSAPLGVTRATAQLNAYHHPMITLFPIFELINYTIIINYETDGAPGSFPIEGTFNVTSGQFNLVMQNYNSTNFNAVRNARFGYFLEHRAAPNAGVRNVGRQNSRNQFMLNRWDQPVMISLEDGVDRINVNWAEGTNGDEIHLWVNWQARGIYINHTFMENNVWRTETEQFSGARFGDDFSLRFIGELGTPTMRLGFRHVGWDIAHHTTDPNDVMGGQVSVSSLYRHQPVVSGTPRGGFQFIGDDYFLRPNVNDNRLVINMFARYEGVELPGAVNFLLRDRDRPETDVVYHQSNIGHQGGANNWFSTQFNWIDVGDLDTNETGIIGNAEQRYVLSLAGRRFNDRIAIDTRINEFGHSVGGTDTLIRFAYWYYIIEVNGVTEERRILPESIGGRPHFALTDTDLINPVTNSFRHNRLVIFPRFANLDFNLFEIETHYDTADSISQMEDDEADILALIAANPDVTDFSILGTDYELLGTPYVDTYGRTFTHVYNATGVNAINLYHNLIFGRGQQNISTEDDRLTNPVFVDIDNRFIRWGYELIGFSVYTNNGIVGDPLVRREFFQGDLLTHAFLIENEFERPTPIMLHPIWRAMNVELQFLRSPFGTTPPHIIAGFPTDGNLTFGTTHPSHVPGSFNVNGSIVIPFESHRQSNGGNGTGFSLPIFHTAADDSAWHHEFRYCFTGNFALNQFGFVNLISQQTRAADFRISDYALRAQFDAIRTSNNHTDPNNPVSWPTIILEANWLTSNSISVNWNLIHRDGDATEITPMTIGGLTSHQMLLRPAVDPINPNRYLVAQDGQFISHLPLPLIGDFDTIPNLHGMRTFGWYHRNMTNNAQFVLMGNEGENFSFLGGINDVIPMDSFQITIYLLYNYVLDGMIRFEAEPGVQNVPSLMTGVSHFDLINLPGFDGANPIRRHGYAFEGWSLAGHYIGGAVVPYTSVSHPANEIYNNTDNRFRAVFRRLPISNPDAWYTDGQTIVMQAQWKRLPVSVIFRDDAPGQGNIIPNFGQGFTLYYNSLVGDSINDPLPTPHKDGHTFVGWYTAPTGALAPIQPGEVLPSRVLPTTLIAQQTPITLHARFIENNFRFNFAVNNPNATIDTAHPQRPLGSGEHTDNLIRHNGFVYDRFVRDLLPLNEFGTPHYMNDPALRFLGWALSPYERTFIMDPEVATRVLLGNTNAFVPAGGGNLAHYTIDVASLTQNAVGVSNANYSRTFDITLYAIWAVDEVNVTYRLAQSDIDDGVSTTGTPVERTVYMFENNQTVIVGGDNSVTVGYGQNGFRTFGHMVLDDTGFARAGHNFAGWLPVNIETGLPFTGTHPLNRLFWPGEFLPSISDSFDMVAQWIPFCSDIINGTIVTPGMFVHSHLNGTRVLSFPSSGTLGQSHFFVNNTLVTNAQVILIPRGHIVIPRESIIANNAFRIHLPTYLDPESTTEQGLQLEARAIVSTSLQWIYVNDALVGVDLSESRPIAEYNPTRTIFNIIAGQINQVGNAHHSVSSFREYRVRQGQLVLEMYETAQGQTTTTIDSTSFEGQSEKYRYIEDAAVWGILYTRTHDGYRNPISGAERKLIAVPSARTGDIAGTVMSGVTTVRSYSIMNMVNEQQILMRQSDTSATMGSIERHAIYHTRVTTLRLPNNTDLTLDNAFISGFNPNLATVTFGNGNAATSPHAHMGTGANAGRLFVGPSSATNQLTYTTTAASAATTIANTAAAFNANRYSLYNWARGLASTAAPTFDAAFYLNGVPGLSFAHFMTQMPQVQGITLTQRLPSVQWTIFENQMLPSGMTITGSNLINIQGATTNPVGQVNSFPIFVDSQVIAQSYQTASGMPRHLNTGAVSSNNTGNSRFVTRDVQIIYNRGTTNNSALGPTGSQTTQNATWGASSTIAALPEAFQFENYTFTGWLVEGTDIVIQAGSTRTIGQVTDATHLYAQGTVRLVAQWAPVLVQFMGGATGTVNLTNNDLRFFLANDNGTLGAEIAITDVRMSTPGTRIFLPGSVHTIGTGNTMTAFVGWRQGAHTTTDWNAAPYNQRFLPTGTNESIHGSGLPIFTLGSSLTTFTALYAPTMTGLTFTGNANIFNTGGVQGMTVTRTGTALFDGGDIRIPVASRQANGFMRPVTEIANRAFWYSTATATARNLVIPETVRNVGSQAFERANIGTVTFSQFQVANIANMNMSNLVIGQNSFAYNYRLATVEIPANTTVIGTRAFLENFALTTVTLAGTTANQRLTTIGTSAFEGSRNLATFFTIPSTVQEIGAFAFALTNINNFATQNTMAMTAAQLTPAWRGTGANRFMFVVNQGHLMMRFESNPQLLTLLVYAPGRTNAIFNADSLRGGTNAQNSWIVNHIGNFAFAHHRHLRDVAIRHQLTQAHVSGGAQVAVTLGDSVFAYARNLENVFVTHAAPANIRTGANNPFRDMPNARIRLVNFGALGTNAIALPAGMTNGTQNIATWQASFPAQSLLFTNSAAI